MFIALFRLCFKIGGLLLCALLLLSACSAVCVVFGVIRVMSAVLHTVRGVVVSKEGTSPQRIPSPSFEKLMILIDPRTRFGEYSK